MKMDLWIKVSLSTVAILLALLRWIFFDVASERMDSIFLLLLAAAVVIYVVPWERLKSLRLGEVEVVLDQPQVKGALEGFLDVKRVDNRQLRESLSRLAPEIQQAKGGRVLWIDDKPHEILGERRLLRALGIEVVTAKDSQSAGAKLEEDNDFDLIVTDIQRADEVDNRETIYGGMYFIKDIREKHDDPVIQSLPVIFYSAYPRGEMKRITQQVGAEALQSIEFSDSIETLLTQVIITLSEVRSNPIKVRSKKKPTSPR